MTPTHQHHGPDGSQGGVPYRPFVPHPAGQHGLFPAPHHGPFPPHIHNALQNHLQMLGQQIGAQVAMQGNRSMAQGPSNPNQAQNLQQQTPPPASFHQIVAQQQQARAAAGQQGAGGQTAGQHLNSDQNLSGVNATPPGNPMNANVNMPNTNTVIQENRGPNGESWRMVIQSTSTVTGLNPSMQRVPTPVNLGFQPPPGMGAQPIPTSTNPHSNDPSSHGSSRSPNQMRIRTLEHEMAAIQTALARGTAPPPTVFEATRRRLANIENIQEIPGLAVSLQTQLDGLATQADQLRANLNAPSRVVSGPNRSMPPDIAPPSIFAQPTSPQNTTASSVYILSSPSGPQALLVSPSGTFSTAWHTHPTGNGGLPLIMHQPNHLSNAHAAPNVHDEAVAPQPRIIPADGPQVQQQPQAQAQANEVRDLLRLLLPLGGPIWLLIRLFGFVYFFTAGGSSRRAFFLGAIAFLVFIAQTGIFRPIVQAVWDPLRRHIETLVAGGNEQNPARQPANLPPAATDGARNRNNRDPTPQEAAARLLQERDRRNRGAVRERFRNFERALALFVGSLVPGFGERHIAARDAAEAVRQAEAREREEARRRAPQEDGEEGEEAVSGEGLAAAGDGQSGEGGGQVQEARGPEQAAQAPLVET